MSFYLFRGKTYNIPVKFWILKNYPNKAPICFVKPFGNMQIKVSTYVDNKGQISLPYLHDWDAQNSKHLKILDRIQKCIGNSGPYSRMEPSNQFNILELIQHCIVAFTGMPPLFDQHIATEIENSSNKSEIHRDLDKLEDLRNVSYYLAKGNYISRHRAKIDILNVLNAFPGLKLKFENIIFKERHQNEIICLLGTILITYK